MIGRTWLRALVPAAAAWALASASCTQETLGQRFYFVATASGVADAKPGWTFTTSSGFSVRLDKATLHVGGVYLNQAVPISGAAETSCFLQGIYVAQVTSAVDVDLLSPSPTYFPQAGEALAGAAPTGEVWLTGGAIDAEDDATVIAHLEGVATQGALAWPFVADVTIGQNRAIPVANPAAPGENPLCKQRIVSPIPADQTLTPGGALALSIDPRPWFAAVDFSRLDVVSTAPALYRFRDDRDTAPSAALFNGMRARVGVYQLGWTK